jgi:hypothetical protein
MAGASGLREPGRLRVRNLQSSYFFFAAERLAARKEIPARMAFC